MYLPKMFVSCKCNALEKLNKRMNNIGFLCFLFVRAIACGLLTVILGSIYS